MILEVASPDPPGHRLWFVKIKTKPWIPRKAGVWFRLDPAETGGFRLGWNASCVLG